MSDAPEDVMMRLEDESGEHLDDDYDRRSWATPEQWRWLKRTRPAYLAAQKGKRLATYLDTLGTEYFEEWSECKLLFGHRDVSLLSEEQKDQLGEAQRVRRVQLRNWHKNRDSKRASKRPLTTLLRAAGVTKKASRLLQAQELFSEKYYKSDVLHLVEEKKEELQDEWGRQLTKGERLNVVKSCTKSVFQAVSEEVKRAIQKELAEAKAAAKAEKAGRALDIDVHNCTLHQYQDTVALAPIVVENVFKPLAAAAGWTFSIYGAGLVPEDDGKIGSMSAHFGHKEDGANFAQVTHDFEEQHVIPFGRYATQVFPRDVQKKRSICAYDLAVELSSTQALSEALPAPSSATYVQSYATASSSGTQVALPGTSTSMTPEISSDAEELQRIHDMDNAAFPQLVASVQEADVTSRAPRHPTPDSTPTGLRFVR
ncbi:hypothetical protein C8T65DRAFT_745875 [Cerioporus squamosus]|nr:hypothetical protein C8T65DRAFT_745875 [Cerioporus squamosus]